MTVQTIQTRGWYLAAAVAGLVLMLTVVAAVRAGDGHLGTVVEAANGDVPPGQLVRKTIVGIVEEVVEGVSIIVSTKHGNVVVNLGPATVVNAPPDKNVGLNRLEVGQKVVVKLNRSPQVKKPKDKGAEGAEAGETVATTTEQTVATTTEGTIATTTEETVATTTVATTTEETTATSQAGASQAATIREVTATLIMIVKSDAAGKIKATRSHKRGVVQTSASCEPTGTLAVVGDDGEVEEFEDQSSEVATSTTTTLALAFIFSSLTPSANIIAFGPIGLGGAAFGDIVLQTATTTATSTTTAPAATTTTAATTSATTTDSGAGVDGEAEAVCENSGDDLILLTRKKGFDSDELVVRATERSAKIDERLESIIEKLEAAGKTDQLDRVVKRFALRKEREGERLQKALDRAGPKTKRDLERAVVKKQDHESKAEDRKQERETKKAEQEAKRQEDKGKGKGASDDKGKK